MSFHYKSGPVTARSALITAFQDIHKSFMSFPLIVAFGWLDIRKKYKRSVIGPFWITCSMAVIIAILGTIFSQVLHRPLDVYLPFLTLGYILWGLISSVIKDSCRVFLNSEGMIKQLSLPLYFYLLRMLWRNIIIFLHNFLIFPFICVLSSHSIGLPALLAIPGFFILFVNLFWISVVVAFLCTRYRDCLPIIDALLLAFFYATPIIWMPSALSARATVFILEPNPMYHLIKIVRDPLMGDFPFLSSWVICSAMAVLGLFLAFYTYGKFRGRLSFWL